MQTKLVSGVLSGLLAIAAHAAERILPKACGSDKDQFEVKMAKPTGDPASPSNGKARIFFVQTYVFKGGSFASFGVSNFTTRFGIDGAWVGAAGNNSYFPVDVEPGEHHVCASVQGNSKDVRDMVGADSVTVEAGKTYYFQLTAQKIHGNSAGYNFYSSSFDQMKPDEGAYKVSSSALSTWSVKH